MLKWIQSRHFPMHTTHHICPHRALIGIGGNIGDTVERFESLWRYWQTSSRLTITETSPILRNPPFGYTAQPDFYNALISICTPLGATELLRYLLYTEKRFGRVRSFANAPRRLDLDMIFYDDISLETRRLYLPHPHWCERDSVVMPLTHMKGTKW